VKAFVHVGAPCRFANGMEIQPPEILLQIMNGAKMGGVFAEPLGQARLRYGAGAGAGPYLNQRQFQLVFSHVRVLEPRSFQPNTGFRYLGRIVQGAHQHAIKIGVWTGRHRRVKAFLGKRLGDQL
jgi:hypothetical protein